MRRFILCLIVFWMGACTKTLHQYNISQGITGQVLWEYGGVDTGDPSYRLPAPLVRKLYFCKPVEVSSLKGDGPLFESLDGCTVVATTTSNNDGWFEIELPEGRYSVFTKEENGDFFGKTYKSKKKKIINPVVVEGAKVVYRNILVKYRAGD